MLESVFCVDQASVSGIAAESLSTPARVERLLIKIAFEANAFIPPDRARAKNTNSTVGIGENVMQVVHFTAGATDPLKRFSAHGVRFVPLADGAGEDETFVSCLHLEPGAWMNDPPAERDYSILVVQGEVTFVETDTRARLELSSGVGVVMNADDRYRLKSEKGAILILVEAERLEATECGISLPERIVGQTWPGEQQTPRPRTLLSVVRKIFYRLKWRKPRRRLVRPDVSAWVAKSSDDSVVGMMRRASGRGGRQA
jgi:hypothetical protein